MTPTDLPVCARAGLLPYPFLHPENFHGDAGASSYDFGPGDGNRRHRTGDPSFPRCTRWHPR